MYSHTLASMRKISNILMHGYQSLSQSLLAEIPSITATTNHVPAEGEYSKVKFRVSIIQEHKEVASDIAYTKIIKA